MILPGEDASKPFIVFGARGGWSEIDPLDPCAQNVCYQLTQIFAEHLEIINCLMENMGETTKKRRSIYAAPINGEQKKLKIIQKRL
jgi:hypothetical protein